MAFAPWWVRWQERDNATLVKTIPQQSKTMSPQRKRLHKRWNHSIKWATTARNDVRLVEMWKRSSVFLGNKNINGKLWSMPKISGHFRKMMPSWDIGIRGFNQDCPDEIKTVDSVAGCPFLNENYGFNSFNIIIIFGLFRPQNHHPTKIRLSRLSWTPCKKVIY